MKNVKRSESSKNNGKMVKPPEDERLTLLQRHVCGGIAGVLSRTVTSPLEVVKVLSQVGTPESRFGFVRSFQRVYQNGGLKAFWRGNGISCLRLAPYSAIQLAAFHELLVSVYWAPVISRINRTHYKKKKKEKEKKNEL